MESEAWKAFGPQIETSVDNGSSSRLRAGSGVVMIYSLSSHTYRACKYRRIPVISNEHYDHHVALLFACIIVEIYLER